MTHDQTPHRPRPERGRFCTRPQEYGRSRLGAPLLWFAASQPSKRSGLIIAGTHGDETASVVALSCALRTLRPETQAHHVILAVNPDGCQLGTRANAWGVDLNRNFPAANWQATETQYRWSEDTPVRDVQLGTGATPGCEPETEALCQLITQLSPPWVISFHEPLACIEDPLLSAPGAWLADAFALPLVRSVGYATPGSFGSWCADNALHCITAELPAISPDCANRDYLSAFTRLLTHPAPGQ
ncbi:MULTISPECIES: murein tripeptide amidase MpaA [Dickeya]|uniref:Murein peptide amidase A n=1 Tax=Dickeya aquatica TaxID=1401087 RepID=A0A375ABW7_9GAMM|nr:MULTISPECIES: murein tripeptide amidase MpaA [Dickeya]SLM63550.1 murein peptide amidase A. murein tripeptide hydrolysis, cleaves glutamyl-DAP bond [Dickeya aquatica]